MNDQKSITTYFGLDVSKEKLDISGTETNKIKHQVFENTSKGINALVRFIKPLTPSAQIILEPTGGYERNVVDALGKAQIAFSKINPYQVRSFATGIGKLAKTDEIDALVLAKFGEHCTPKPTQPLDTAQEELRDLYDRCQQLTNAKTRESNRLETASPKMKSHLKKSLKFIESQIEEINKMIDEYFSAHPEAQKKINRLQEVTGIGKKTATVFAAYMPELGQISNKAAAALVGVAPFNRDSGKTRAYRCIQRGRHQIRHVLYMAAVCASQKNHILKKFYDHLIAQGKPAKVALVAVMRKLVMLLNHMIKNPNFSLAN
jgi:transposase